MNLFPDWYYDFLVPWGILILVFLAFLFVLFYLLINKWFG